jgi:hypothetical protein
MFLLIGAPFGPGRRWFDACHEATGNRKRQHVDLSPTRLSVIARLAGPHGGRMPIRELQSNFGDPMRRGPGVPRNVRGCPSPHRGYDTTAPGVTAAAVFFACFL